ncbi:MAG: hypothetical protein Q8O38_07115 [Sulfurimicrobium sp.]|nr:hypothetical protein [Sulfurimicrobium sp.]
MANKTALTLAVGAALASSLTVANAAENPFAMKSMENGYMVAYADYKAKEGKCGGDKKAAEGKCGAAKDKETESGGDKKVKEAKCGGDKKATEGKCGAAK